MNRLALPLLICASVLACTRPVEAVVDGTASVRIVTVSFNAVVVQTAEAQKQLGALQAKFAPRQARLKALNEEVEALRKQLSDTSAKSDGAGAVREQTLEVKERQLQRETDDYKTDSQNESQEVFRTIAQRVYTFLQTYAQQRGYSAVIERGSDTEPVVWYAADNLDITEQLVKAYNEQAQPSGRGSTGSAPTSGPGVLPESPAPKK
jgi:outer membrane protein